MRSLIPTVVLVVAFGVAAGLTSAPAQNAGGEWVTVKGQVKLPKAPEPRAVAVAADKEHCESKGGLVYEDVIVSKKTQGLRSVVVWLRPDNTDRRAAFPPDKIKPELAKAAPKSVQVDQPTCQFVPRVVAARAGDTFVFKNSAPVNHNVNYSSDGESFNVNLQPGGSKTTEPLKAQSLPVRFACNIHPWMEGRAWVFDHPYFAVTDADGKFEIKDAPAGRWRIVYWHERGFHKGKDGNAGFPVAVKAGAGNVMQLEPIGFELSGK